MSDQIPGLKATQVWQVVLDMPSKEAAIELARYHVEQRDGFAAVQMLTRYVPSVPWHGYDSIEKSE